MPTLVLDVVVTVAIEQHCDHATICVHHYTSNNINDNPTKEGDADTFQLFDNQLASMPLTDPYANTSMTPDSADMQPNSDIDTLLTDMDSFVPSTWSAADSSFTLPSDRAAKKAPARQSKSGKRKAKSDATPAKSNKRQKKKASPSVTSNSGGGTRLSTRSEDSDSNDILGIFIYLNFLNFIFF